MTTTSTQVDPTGVVLSVKDLTKTYVRGAGRAKMHVPAVRGVSFDIPRGTTTAIVGESGCGKSSVANAIMQLDPPSSGEVWLDGVELTSLPRAKMRDMRRRIQMVFQDPYSSLNGRQTVGEIVREPLDIHFPEKSMAWRVERAVNALERVGMHSDVLRRRPHQFSGGQRQRIGIARAIVVEPQLVVCDEAVSALDVSVQAQVLNLLKDLQRDGDLTFLFITHDLSVVRQIADVVVVMYLGRIVEMGPTDRVLGAPRHPYTRALMDAVPGPGMLQRIATAAGGDIPSPASAPSGCSYHPRCFVWRGLKEQADLDLCSSTVPEMGVDGCACFFPVGEGLAIGKPASS